MGPKAVRDKRLTAGSSCTPMLAGYLPSPLADMYRTMLLFPALSGNPDPDALAISLAHA